MWADNLNSRFLLFTGKGGVGKTSLACAAAVHLARRAKRTLIVSTDPASNLDEVFGVHLGVEPTAIEEVEGLFGANLDPEAAAAAYREAIVGPFRGRLPDAVVRNMEEQFSGACTTEIAAFDEFVRLVADQDILKRFDHIVFDTAPTGHTLRLLSLPSAWTGYLNTTTAEASCLGPLAGLQDKRALYESALKRLADPLETTVVLVARPDGSSLTEADRTRSELESLGICNLALILNAVYSPQSLEDSVAAAYAEATASAIAKMPEGLSRLPMEKVPMIRSNVVGLEALEILLGESESANDIPSLSLPEELADLDDLTAALESSGRGVIMTMGKGGVGKTRVAELVAQRLASRGHRVLLTSTDPAGDVDRDLAAENLEVARIDPAAEVAAYTERTLAMAAETMDQDALALLEEDLRSPCTEEIAVFRAFAEAVARGEEQFVIIDTAPTGHTILLMDATEAYHREVARTQSDAPESVRSLLPRLRDPEFTKIILVTLPEPTPVHEAARLQDDLRRAGIEPYAWVVNRSFALAGVREATLAARAASESQWIGEARALCDRMVVLPWVAQVGRLKHAIDEQGKREPVTTP